MKKILISLAASVVLAAPAAASITYSLTGTDFSGNTTTLSFTTGSLLTSNQQIPAAGLNSCTYGADACSQVAFFTDVSPISIFGDQYDAIAVFPADRTDPSVYVYYYFGNGDLGRTGVYQSLATLQPGTVAASATLRVTDSSAVPEPASWALMLGGFGMAGGALRRRRTSVRFA